MRTPFTQRIVLDARERKFKSIQPLKQRFEKWITGWYPGKIHIQRQDKLAVARVDDRIQLYRLAGRNDPAVVVSSVKIFGTVAKGNI